GLASAAEISRLVGAVLGEFKGVEIGVHLHSRPQDAAEKVLAAYDAGCRRFDCAVGGLGGCPFAQDELVGNIPTEKVLEALAQRGVAQPVARPLDEVMRMSAEIGQKYGA
ncbi:MAG: hydroxymethylglutaryl-CoA lyase, partial [Opitutaceae bacterium]